MSDIAVVKIEAKDLPSAKTKTSVAPIRAIRSIGAAS